MKLLINQKARVVPTEKGRKTPDGQSVRKPKAGRIISITPYNITVAYSKNGIASGVKESFDVGAIIDPSEYNLLAWDGSKWMQVALSEGAYNFKTMGWC